MALTDLGRLARLIRHRRAENGHRVAEATIPRSLEETLATGTTDHRFRNRVLIRQMSSANPLWGAPRIVGELEKIGIEVAKSTVERYPSSPTWKAFLRNHVSDLVSVDFFVVPTARFRILFVFLVLATERR